MDIKKILQPGMLVQLHNGDVTIVTLSTGYPKELILSWNDGSGRSLCLSDYIENLMYNYNDTKHQDFNIDKIYDIGSFWEPFNMEVKNRNIIWSRDGEGFSLAEKSLAHAIKTLIKGVAGSSIEEISIYKHELEYIKIVGLPAPIELIIPDDYFINLKPNKLMNLDDIINGEILQ